MKGRLLASPKGFGIRPTSDLVREAVFNIIGQDLSDQKVLDLFSGTGSLGLEALSRGALCAFFVDNSQESIGLIRKNLTLLGYKGRGVIIRRDLRKRFPQDHSILKERFGVVFLDPPYRKGLVSFWLEELSVRGPLSSGALVIAESAEGEKFSLSLENLQMLDSRLYGDTRITIYGYEER